MVVNKFNFTLEVMQISKFQRNIILDHKTSLSRSANSVESL